MERFTHRKIRSVQQIGSFLFLICSDTVGNPLNSAYLDFVSGAGHGGEEFTTPGVKAEVLGFLTGC